MAEVQKLPAICADDECERGERGKRGHRGHDGATGPTGPTGPTLLHTQDTETDTFPLPNNSITEVLTCPAIVPGLGNQVQITGAVGIELIGNASNTDAAADATLLEDGVEIARFSTSLAPITGDGVFDFFGTIPVVWTFVAADGLPHVYSINIITDSASNGAWAARDRSMFVNILSP